MPLSDSGSAGLRAVLDAPEQALLAVDYDGTLAPIVDDPDAAYAQPGAVEVLTRLTSRLGTVVILTGRPVAVVRRLAELEDVPGLEVLGQYGVERWDLDAQRVVAPEPPASVARARADLPTLLAALGVDDAFVEDKVRALGVHVRRSADPERSYARLLAPLAAFAAEHGLLLEPGKLVLELRAPGMDKGAALKALVAQRGARTVIYAGDDLGDLAAYDTVEALRREGLAGLLICSLGAERTALADRADVVVDGPGGVVAWLSDLADRLNGWGAGQSAVVPPGLTTKA